MRKRRQRYETPEPRKPKKDLIQLEGVITECLPNATFRVQLDKERLVFAHVSGRMRMHFIKILPGDRVTIEFSPYDLSRGRIIYRFQIDRKTSSRTQRVKDSRGQADSARTLSSLTFRPVSGRISA